jgi:hypothetical protein
MAAGYHHQPSTCHQPVFISTRSNLMSTTYVHLDPTHTEFESRTKIESAPPGSVILLSPGDYHFPLYTLLRVPDNIYIQPESGIRTATIHCPGGLHIRNPSTLQIGSICINGRINIDADRPKYGDVIIFGVKWVHTHPVSHKEMLKLSHVNRVIVEGCALLHTGNITDRLINCVGSHDLSVSSSYFENPLQGAIQVKGGAQSPRITGNIVNCTKPAYGQRAIQLGGSSCATCFGYHEDGSKIQPEEVGWECLDGVVAHNRIYNCVTPFVSSTSKGNLFRNNLSYYDGRFTSSYLARILQEEEDGANPRMNGQQDILFEDNIWMYHVGQINAEVINKGGNGRPQLYDTIKWNRNAFYAVSPIKDANLGRQGIYPHRHPVVRKGQWNPMDITGDGSWIDQEPLYIRGHWHDCKTTQDKAPGPNIVGGPDWFRPHKWAGVPELPADLDSYQAAGVDTYGWAGPGIDISEYVEPTPEPPAPPAPPVDPGDELVQTNVHYELRVGSNGHSIAACDTEQEARDFLDDITIWRVSVTTQSEPLARELFDHEQTHE